MLTQEHFSTVDRQGYIDAGVRAAQRIREQLQHCPTLFLGIKGPNKAGKSLFLDAIVHELADGLDPKEIPHHNHMMLEKHPDEARGNYVSDIFNINSIPTTIGFVNISALWNGTLPDLLALKSEPGLHLSSFEPYSHEGIREEAFETLPLSAIYEIGKEGEDLNRQWTAWHQTPSALRRVRG